MTADVPDTRSSPYIGQLVILTGPVVPVLIGIYHISVIIGLYSIGTNPEKTGLYAP